MAVFWVTETIPLPVTALLPMVIFPLLGVADAREISREYLKDTNMLFVGGFMMAVAVERWNLHKRIALRVLLLVGPEPKWLMLGFMLPSAFLSMWISNTATTAMIVPIARAVVEQLIATRTSNVTATEDSLDQNSLDSHSVSRASAIETEVRHIQMINLRKPPVNEKRENSYDVTVVQVTKPNDLDGIRKGMTLCVAYAATCGGVATLTGTGPNLVFKGQTDSLFNHDAGVNFTSWFVFAFPCTVMSLMACYVWLQVNFLGIRNSVFVCKRRTEDRLKEQAATEVLLRKELNALGPMTFAEVMVAIHFIALALLWLTRESDFFRGWGNVLPAGTASDSTPAILLAISLFIVPSARPNFLCLRSKNGRDSNNPGPRVALLDWDTVTHKFSWGIVLLLGGGYALALACQKSGLSQLLASELTVFRDIPPWALCIIITTMIAAITEVTSNVAIATIFLPILAQLSVGIGVHPLYLMIPGCMSTSFAFMLPVATPPNAIVFSYGTVRVLDMAKAGLVLNLICVAIVNLAINTWGYAYFRLGEFPDWANRTHSVSNQIGHCVNVTTI
ncbi:solute carrier family 13 member 2-like [Liolophura sinensis]|uniref:solute carrier family 13 member 2-like n=1 Tax=Liolophura sinensis TaxID=3198878 RepID=UPI00315848E6